ncbi:unnamed protein product [Sphagnum jensenii]|uniref:Uncharacterized protein n=1 Tax=Sphagnum jensenii TaxID=128206 RepID=A0ABP1BF37_9BRYO
MMGSFITRGMIMALGYAYPAYECFKIVERNRPDSEDLRFWCQYWIIIAVLTVLERVGDVLVSWVPMYSEAKLAFIIYLWYPKTKGTTYVYTTFLRPLVSRHELEIDRNLNELSLRAADVALVWWQRGSVYIQARFYELLQFIASQSNRPQAAPRRPPTPPIPPRRDDDNKKQLLVKKKGGSDDEESLLSPPASQVDEEEENGGEKEEDDDDGVEWQTDTSAEAAKRRITEQLTAATSEMMSEVLWGAGTVGLGKAVDALDTLGSTMVNLQPGRRFASGASPKGQKIGILAFEVANTIVKGCNLKQSMCPEEMRVLKEETMTSEGVKQLVSTDFNELMWIAATDKREELKIFSGEVVRFGNHCRNPQWHQLDRVFDRLGAETEIQRQSNEQADIIMQNLSALAQNTAELYHELHALDRFQTDLKRKQQEDEVFSSSGSRAGDSLVILKSEVKSQEKHIKTLKKRSLWSKILEEVMEQLVDVVYYLYQEIHDNFGPAFSKEAENFYKPKTASLGTSGLSLHYANIINQIDNLVSRPTSVPPNTRDMLYQGLSPSMKASLRTHLQQSSELDLLSKSDIQEELDNILDWLGPVASNTTKVHHGFGWVGEWANTGSSLDRKAMGQVELTLLQTLHHANQEKVESYILKLIVGLHHLVRRAQNQNIQHSPQKSPVRPVTTWEKPMRTFLPERSISPPPFQFLAAVNGQHNYMVPAGAARPELSQGDKEILQAIDQGSVAHKVLPGLSKSQEFDTSQVAANRESSLRLSKSNSHSPSTNNKMESPLSLYKSCGSSNPPPELHVDRRKELDVIDRVDSFHDSPQTHSQ